MAYDFSKLKVKKLNDETALLMADFYLFNDPWISRCRDYINDMTFKGNIEIEWLKKFTAKKDVLFSQTELVDLLTKCLDWKKLYGMCPYKIIEGEKGTKKVFIPQFGEGSFYQVHNPHTLQSVVFYIVKNKKYGFISEYMPPESFAEIVKESGLHVFVWPGMQPNFHTNDYSSEIAKIYRLYLVKQSFLKDSIDASYNSTHPTVFTQSAIEHTNMEDYTEPEAFGEISAGFDIPGPPEIKMFRRDIYREKGVKNLSSAIKKLGFEEEERKMMQEDTKNLEFKRPLKYWENNIFTLPVNERMAPAPVARPTVNIEAIEENYKTSVCLIMGLSKTLVEGQFRRETSSSNEMIKQNLRTLINKHRRDTEMFIQDVYNTMYGLQDRTMLLETIIEWKEEVEKLKSLNGTENEDTKSEREEYLRQKELEIEMLKHMMNRSDLISIVFEEQPLLETENIRDIEYLRNNDYITSEEAIDITRKIMGLPQLSPAEVKKLIDQRQEKIDFEKEKMMAKVKKQEKQDVPQKMVEKVKTVKKSKIEK